MNIEKLNDLTYVLHFDDSIQAKKLYRYLYKASKYLCNLTDEVGCNSCEITDDCYEYWKLIDALSEIAE